jgi:hypothetical protein
VNVRPSSTTTAETAGPSPAHCGTFQIAATLKRAFDTAHAAGWPDGQRFLVDLSQLTRTAREPLPLTKDSWLALVLETRGVWNRG